MQGRREQLDVERSSLEQTLELGVGPPELPNRASVEGDGFIGTEKEELAAEQKRDPGSPNRVLGQPVGLLQMLDCRITVHVRFGGAELERHLGQLGRGRWLRERAAQISDGVLGGAAR